MNAKEVLAYAKKNNVVMVDLRFTDWPGLWQHCSYPISMFDEDVFEDGFDGSSIRGWQVINESDMLMVPDPETAFIDPFFQHPTLVMVCDIVDPVTREPYHRDPRYIARKAVNHLKASGIGDTAYIGPEAEFFIFNDIKYGTSSNEGFFFFIDSVEMNRLVQQCVGDVAKITLQDDQFHQRVVGEKHRHLCGLGDTPVEPLQQGAAASKHDALIHDVCVGPSQLGDSLPEGRQEALHEKRLRKEVIERELPTLDHQT